MVVLKSPNHWGKTPQPLIKKSRIIRVTTKFAGMTDILLDKDNDLLFENGDLAVGFSDNQNQHLILMANQGEYKEFPALGVGIVEMLSNEDPDSVLIRAKRHLEYDGMKVRNIRFERNGKLIVDAKYKA